MMKRDSRRLQRGQATLEFLIIVPMILLMISLVLYAGWWTYAKLSAQNAAYAYGIWSPRVQLGMRVGRIANLSASEATLSDAIGMKPMWSEDIPNTYTSGPYTHTRLGGTGLTVAVSARGLGWDEWLDVWEAIGLPESDVQLPRGTAFFFYSPFMSARQR
jgi:hypothetical protein